jgi:hypothetical protein
MFNNFELPAKVKVLFSLITYRVKTPNCLHQNVKAFKAKRQGVFKKDLDVFKIHLVL